VTWEVPCGEGFLIFKRTALLGSFTLFASALLQAGPIVYTSDPNLADLTAGLTNFATFLSSVSSDFALPFTPTAASLATGLRVGGFGAVPTIITQFAAPVSSIRVFSSIDHFGDGWDYFQYSISGSNDGVAYDPLFDATSVVGSAPPFTLGTFTGTGPFQVNNVLTPGAAALYTVGYEADFKFAKAYRWYSFGASTAALAGGNQDEEISAVASLDPTPVPTTFGSTPEPSTFVGALIGGCLIGLIAFRQKRAGRWQTKSRTN
jgi:hypothetical protein